MNFDDISYAVHKTAVEKGFWDPLGHNHERGDEFVFYAKQLAMIHSEVTETLEALRKDKGEKAVVEELADILVRVFDLYQGLLEYKVVESSLNDVFFEKIDYNKTRDRLHGVKG